MPPLDFGTTHHIQHFEIRSSFFTHCSGNLWLLGHSPGWIVIIGLITTGVALPALATMSPEVIGNFCHKCSRIILASLPQFSKILARLLIGRSVWQCYCWPVCHNLAAPLPSRLTSPGRWCTAPGRRSCAGRETLSLVNCQRWV